MEKNLYFTEAMQIGDFWAMGAVQTLEKGKTHVQVTFSGEGVEQLTGKDVSAELLSQEDNQPLELVITPEPDQLLPQVRLQAVQATCLFVFSNPKELPLQEFILTCEANSAVFELWGHYPGNDEA
ncbi:MAG: hypothetical protein AAGF10_07775 [Verrucomicrobiota bacterium]